MNRSFAATALGVALAAVVLVALMRQVALDWRALEASALDYFHLKAPPLAGAWLVQTAGWLLLISTWRSIADRLGGRLGFVRHARLHAYSSLAHVLPGSIWVPAGRVAIYRHHTVPVFVTTAAVTIEWLLLGLAGLVLYGLSAPFSESVAPGWAPLLLVVGLGSVLLLHPAVFHRAVGIATRLFDREAELPRLGGRSILVWFACELSTLALSGLALYLFMIGVTPIQSIADAMAAAAWTMAVANLLAWLPLTAILKDGGMVFILTPLYGSSVIALGMVIAWRIWVTLCGLSWAGLATLLDSAATRRSAEADGHV